MRIASVEYMCFTSWIPLLVTWTDGTFIRKKKTDGTFFLELTDGTFAPLYMPSVAPSGSAVKTEQTEIAEQTE